MPAKKAGAYNKIFNLLVSWQEDVIQLAWGREKCFVKVFSSLWTSY